MCLCVHVSMSISACVCVGVSVRLPCACMRAYVFHWGVCMNVPCEYACLYVYPSVCLRFYVLVSGCVFVGVSVCMPVCVCVCVCVCACTCVHAVLSNCGGGRMYLSLRHCIYVCPCAAAPPGPFACICVVWCIVVVLGVLCGRCCPAVSARREGGNKRDRPSTSVMAPCEV